MTNYDKALNAFKDLVTSADSYANSKHDGDQYVGSLIVFFLAVACDWNKSTRDGFVQDVKDYYNITD